MRGLGKGQSLWFPHQVAIWLGTKQNNQAWQKRSLCCVSQPGISFIPMDTVRRHSFMPFCEFFPCARRMKRRFCHSQCWPVSIIKYQLRYLSHLEKRSLNGSCSIPKSPESETKLQANGGKDGVSRGHELGKKGKTEMEILKLSPPYHYKSGRQGRKRRMSHIIADSCFIQ